MIRLKLKRTNRIFVAATLLLLFTFTSIFATYQSSKYLDVAYASYSGSCSNNSGSNAPVGVIDCGVAIMNCAYKSWKAREACKEHGAGSLECITAVAAAAVACAKVPSECW